MYRLAEHVRLPEPYHQLWIWGQTIIPTPRACAVPEPGWGWEVTSTIPKSHERKSVLVFFFSPHQPYYYAINIVIAERGEGHRRGGGLN